MANEGITNTSYVLFRNSDKENENSTERKTKIEEMILNDAVEIVSLNSHSPETSTDKQPVLALRFLVAFTVWLGLFIVHGGRLFAFSSIGSHHIHPYLKTLDMWPSDDLNCSMKTENATVNNMTTAEQNCTFEQEFESYEINVGRIGVYSVLSFMCGYAVSGIPAGYLAHIYPPTRIFFFGVTTSCLVNIFYPVIISSFGALLAAHIFQGLAEGMILPACFGTWAYWSVTKERNYIVLTSYTGMLFGILAGSEFCRQLMDQWETGYYMFGLLALLWLFLWMCVYTIPELIESENQQKPVQIFNMCMKGIHKNAKPVPWKAILSSKAVWAIVMATACHRGFFALIFHPELAHHHSLGGLLKFNISGSKLLQHFGTVFYLPFSLSIMMLLLLVLLHWYLTSHRNVPVIRVRKIFTCLGIFLQIPSVFLTSHLRVPWLNFIVFVLPLIGYFLNPLDIAPKFSPIVVGVSNTFANLLIISIVAIIVPFIGGDIIIIMITLVVVMAIFLIATCIFYAVYASAVTQAWSE